MEVTGADWSSKSWIDARGSEGLAAFLMEDRIRSSASVAPADDDDDDDAAAAMVDVGVF